MIQGGFITRLLNKVAAVGMASAMVFSMAECGSKTAETTAVPVAETTAAASGETTATPAEAKDPNAKVKSKDKPLVWFNRQPSNSTTGQLDMAALNYNKDTYYVGFGASQGVELQGTMVKEYIEKNTDSTNRNGDGIIGYVLAIGNTGHNGSIAHIRGVRKVLGTAVEKDGNINSDPIDTNTDGTSTIVQNGKIEVNGKSYIVREPVSRGMKNSAGATWDATIAGDGIGTWSFSFGDQIDTVASNNDGMGMSMFNVQPKDNKVPTFGYDANSDAVTATAEGYGGTISQYADAQVYLTLYVLRNALDGVDIDTGTDTADDAGNALSEGVYVYKANERSYYVLNVTVTGENYSDLMDSAMAYILVSNQFDEGAYPTKNVWLNVYNPADNFLDSTCQPLPQKYDKLLDLKVEYIGDDGQTESNITNRLGNPNQHDVFATNMVKTDNATSYTNILNQ